MRRSAIVIALSTSVAVWISGSALWVNTEQGSATGSALFPWLWVPSVVCAVVLLLARTSRRGGTIGASIAAASFVFLAITVLNYDWGRSPYLLQLASAHSGIQIDAIEVVEVQPLAFIAAGLLILTALAIVVSSWLEVPEVRGPKGENLTVGGSTDSRSLWDEQTN